MDPWDIEKLDELLFFCCPECNEKEKSKEAFLNHATTKHPHAKERLKKFLFEEEDNKIVIKQEIQQVKSEFYEEEDYDYYYGYGGNDADEPEVLYEPDVKIKTDNNGDTMQKPKKVRKKICQFCKLGFKNNFYLKYHIKTVHPNEVKNEEGGGAANEEQQPENKSPAEKKLKKVFKLEDIECKICQKSFSSKSALRAHQITVHEGVRHQCELCEKSFTQLQSLQSHVQSFHEGKRFPCDICGETLAQMSGLRQHIRFTHQKEKRHSKYTFICRKKGIFDSKMHFDVLIFYFLKFQFVTSVEKLLKTPINSNCM